MSKIELETLASGYTDVSLLNRNFQRIAEWSATVLSRLGVAPNQLEADLDLNGYTLLNAGANMAGPDGLVSYAMLTQYVDQRAAGIVQLRRQRFTALPNQQVFNLTQFSYVPGSQNLSVYVDGIRKFAPMDFSEDTDASFSFPSPLPGGTVVEALSTEFLGNVSLPPHQHAWEDIVAPPEQATRWPTYAEVGDKPTTFPPTAHQHSAGDITTGRLADARRGVFVQSGAPTSPQVGDLWMW